MLLTAWGELGFATTCTATMSVATTQNREIEARVTADKERVWLHSRLRTSLIHCLFMQKSVFQCFIDFKDHVKMCCSFWKHSKQDLNNMEEKNWFIFSFKFDHFLTKYFNFKLKDNRFLTNCIPSKKKKKRSRSNTLYATFWLFRSHGKSQKMEKSC